MTQEPTEHETYIKLYDLCRNVVDGDHEFTDAEKREIGNILADIMTAYECYCDIFGTQDIWDMIADDYNEMEDLTLARVYIGMEGFSSIDTWIEANGLPFPNAGDMVERIVEEIDEEEYINDHYDDILDMLPDQCEFNLDDEEIVYLFNAYVTEPAED